MSKKQEIRLKMKKIRQELSQSDLNFCSDQICLSLLASDFYKNAKAILFYSPIQNEISLNRLAEDSLNVGKEIYYPKTGANGHMDFYRIISLNQLSPGNFGVPEPDSSNPIFDSKEGLILVPALAFDSMGYRVGYGKGFYDRYLSRFPQLTSVGIGYQFQMNQEFERDENDVPLEYLFSEKGRIK